MLLGNAYLTDSHLILRDVDGSEVSITLQDALNLRDWLNQHRIEILTRQKQLQSAKQQEQADLRDQHGRTVISFKDLF